jgi:hypothetical protein
MDDRLCLDRAHHDRRKPHWKTTAMPARDEFASACSAGGIDHGPAAGRTRFTSTSNKKIIMGVRAGIANHTGLDVNLVRIGLVLSVFIAPAR